MGNRVLAAGGASPSLLAVGRYCQAQGVSVVVPVGREVSGWAEAWITCPLVPWPPYTKCGHIHDRFSVPFLTGKRGPQERSCCTPLLGAVLAAEDRRPQCREGMNALPTGNFLKRELSITRKTGPFSLMVLSWSPPGVPWGSCQLGSAPSEWLPGSATCQRSTPELGLKVASNPWQAVWSWACDFSPQASVSISIKWAWGILFSLEKEGNSGTC